MAVIGIIVTVAFGLLFYILRCRQRLLYGLVEFVVALAVIILTFLLSEESSWWGWLLSKGVGTSAGIYVMVRGLDNIQQGFRLNGAPSGISYFMAGCSSTWRGFHNLSRLYSIRRFTFVSRTRKAAYCAPSSVHLQRRDKSLLRNLGLAELPHLFLARLLLFQQLALAGRIAAMAFRGHTLRRAALSRAR
jgi:hypothetical protein